MTTLSGKSIDGATSTARRNDADQSTSRPFQVNFLIAGTQKGGTTALNDFISGHPDICRCPGNEPHFFDSIEFDDSASYEEINSVYQQFFPNFNGQSAVGEKTPSYLHQVQAHDRIQRYNRRMKFIIILRNPIERAASAFRMSADLGRITCTFHEALFMNGPEIIKEFRTSGFISSNDWMPLRNWNKDKVRLDEVNRFLYFGLINFGFYGAQLRRLYKFFPPEQVLVLRNSELRNSHENTMRRIYDFLHVDPPNRIPPAEIIASRKSVAPPSPETIALLKEIYNPDIRELEDMMGWDLSDWQ